MPEEAGGDAEDADYADDASEEEPDPRYPYQKDNLLPGEDQPGNRMWAGQARNRTYYPDQQTATDSYGVTVEDGRIVVEVDEGLARGSAGPPPVAVVGRRGLDGPARPRGVRLRVTAHPARHSPGP